MPGVRKIRQAVCEKRKDHHRIRLPGGAVFTPKAGKPHCRSGAAGISAVHRNLAQEGRPEPIRSTGRHSGEGGDSPG
nr:MAG TPA: hypothetical protein [Caudoviricetes sp.]